MRLRQESNLQYEKTNKEEFLKKPEFLFVRLYLLLLVKKRTIACRLENEQRVFPILKRSLFVLYLCSETFISISLFSVKGSLTKPAL